MQQLTGFMISIFLFAVIFMNASVAVADRHYHRIAKQDLNLIGKEVINHIDRPQEDRFLIDEKAFYSCAVERYRSGDLLGCIFVYPDKISTIKGSGTEIKSWKFFLGNESQERNRIDAVNQMLYLILPDISHNYVINIIETNSKDYKMNRFFNSLSDHTIFLVGYSRGQILLAGFDLYLRYPQNAVDICVDNYKMDEAGYKQVKFKKQDN